MYLIDTNVISEFRKKLKINSGVKEFLRTISNDDIALYISVITIGELRRGIELIRHRGDIQQASQLEKWLEFILDEYQDNILNIDEDVAQLWGKLRSPHPENTLDKQIAATAIIHDLIIVTLNEKDFTKTGVKVLNSFS